MATDTTATPASQADTDEQPTNAEGTTPQAAGDEPLGEGGKRALDAERELHKQAAKEAALLRKQLEEARTASQADADEQAKQLSSVQEELAQLKAENARMAVSAATGVPADLLKGPGDDLEAWAKALNDWKGAAASAPASEPAPPSWGAFNVSTPDKKTPTLPEQIAAAEKTGDRALASALKASMLSGR